MTQKDYHKRPLFSFLLSLLTHVILILLLGVSFSHFHHTISLQETPILETPPEVILNLTPPQPEKKQTIDTSSEHPLEKAPEDTIFESHENTEAASELPPTGDLPAPTQEGDHNDDLSFKNQEHTRGVDDSTALLDQPSAVIDQSRPSPEPESKPTPASTPLPQDTLPSSLQSSTPLPTPPTLAKPTPGKDKPVMGTLSSHAKAQGYQADERSSVIHGNISNKGKASVAAEATPLGRYKKDLSDAIRSRWYYYIDDHMELLDFGTTAISFYVTQQGKVEGLHILSNTSNQAFADCCIKSIIEAKLPLIPPGIAATLQEERLEIEYRFTVYPNAE